MQINIISDPVCPWCYVGKKKFEKALDIFRAQHPGEEVTFAWRPFQLDPTLPKEGVDRKAYYRRKFGDSPQIKKTGEMLTQMGKDLGISFAFDKIERSPNTLDAHRLIRWAGSAGCQDKIVAAIFAAYFEEARNIGETDVLVDIADKNGMDGNLVRDLLEQETDTDLVQKDVRLAGEMGISGVPTFIIDQKFPISGAQEPDTILHFLNKALEVKAKEALAT
jgi:predicted DsbA family dithiol-disulfide isomerase